MEIQEKICNECNILLPIDRFVNYTKTYPSGKQYKYFQGKCNKCIYLKRKNNPLYMEKQEMYKKSKSIAHHKMKQEKLNAYHKMKEKKKLETLLNVRTSIKRYFNSDEFKLKKRKLNESSSVKD